MCTIIRIIIIIMIVYIEWKYKYGKRELDRSICSRNGESICAIFNSVTKQAVNQFCVQVNFV